MCKLTEILDQVFCLQMYIRLYISEALQPFTNFYLV
jgi:hypothetical protein